MSSELNGAILKLAGDPVREEGGPTLGRDPDLRAEGRGRADPEPSAGIIGEDRGAGMRQVRYRLRGTSNPVAREVKCCRRRFETRRRSERLVPGRRAFSSWRSRPWSFDR